MQVLEYYSGHYLMRYNVFGQVIRRNFCLHLQGKWIYLGGCWNVLK